MVLIKRPADALLIAPRFQRLGFSRILRKHLEKGMHTYPTYMWRCKRHLRLLSILQKP
jgi:hypothetical protein